MFLFEADDILRAGGLVFGVVVTFELSRKLEFLLLLGLPRDPKVSLDRLDVLVSPVRSPSRPRTVDSSSALARCFSWILSMIRFRSRSDAVRETLRRLVLFDVDVVEDEPTASAWTVRSDILGCSRNDIGDSPGKSPSIRLSSSKKSVYSDPSKAPSEGRSSVVPKPDH
jgi:hypothetical protein